MDPLTLSDIYGSPSSLDENTYGGYYSSNAQAAPTVPLTRRVSDVFFSPVATTLFTLVAIPVMIAAIYWLFVVNGPTPVVKARVEPDTELLEEHVDQPAAFDWAPIVHQILKLMVPVIEQET